jgi:hypothetical protein
VIGREGEVRPFDVIRWAREQARVEHVHDGEIAQKGESVRVHVRRRLTTMEAHVLLLLATYADRECVAYPSLKTLAELSGIKPKRVKTRKGGVYFTASQVSEALQWLERFGLVWTVQGGRGRTARRELLYNPAEGLPSATAERKGRMHSATAEQNYQEVERPEQQNGSTTELPESCLPPGRKATDRPRGRSGIGLRSLDVIAVLPALANGSTEGEAA